MRQRRALVYCGAIVVACFAMYAKSLRYPFVNWDDYSLITLNPYITQLSWESIKDMFTPGVVGAYQPLRDLTYAIDYRLWGLNPLGYHISNLMFYILTCLSVFAFVLLLTQESRLAIWGSLLFAAHPLHVEAVTWLSARKETLSGFLFLLAFILYARSTRPDLRYYWGSLMCFILALLSKPTVVILPALLVLHDFCFITRGNVPKLLRRAKWYAPYFGLAAILTYVTIMLSTKGGVLKSFHGGTLFSQILTSFTVFIKNIRLLVVPINLSPRYADYSYVSILEPEALLAVIACALIALLAWDMWKRSILFFFCILWYPITFLPVSNLIPISTLMADRYLFLPSVAFALLFALLVGKISGLRRTDRVRKILRTAGLAACLALLGVYSGQTVNRNSVWKDNISLWRNAVEQDSTNALGHFALGNVYLEAGLQDESIKHYRKAVSLAPAFSTAQASLANAYLAKGEIDRAIFHYKEALATGSAEDLAIYANMGMAFEYKGLLDKAIIQYEKALEVDSTFAIARLGLAEAYSKKDQYDLAIEAYRDLIRINEDGLRARVYFNLGVAQHMRGLYDDAIASYTKAIEIDSTFADAYYGLGNAHDILGEQHAAVADYRNALRLWPGHLGAMSNLANVYSDLGMAEKAIQQYEAALVLSPTSLVVLNNLGLAYVEVGQFDRAVARFGDVLDLDPKNANAYMNMGYAYARRGMYDEAVVQYRKAVEIDSADSVGHYNLACAYALKNERSLSVASLRKAIELGFDDRELILTDPDLDNIRDEGEFRELVEGM